jgi:hypothetical protein
MQKIVGGSQVQAEKLISLKNANVKIKKNMTRMLNYSSVIFISPRYSLQRRNIAVSALLFKP